MPANPLRISKIDFSNRNTIATVAVCYPSEDAPAAPIAPDDCGTREGIASQVRRT